VAASPAFTLNGTKSSTRTPAGLRDHTEFSSEPAAETQVPPRTVHGPVSRPTAADSNGRVTSAPSSPAPPASRQPARPGFPSSGDCLLHSCGGVGVAMADSAGANRSEPDAGAVRAGGHRFHRSIGLRSGEPRRPRRRVVCLRLRHRHRGCLVHRLACRGGRRLSGLGPVPPQLAFRPKGDRREFREARRGHLDRAPSPGRGGRAHWA